MALFLDGTISTLEELRAYESSVIELAAVEGLDLAAKLELAQKEIGVELQEFLSDHGDIGAQTADRSVSDLSPVVVTEPLQQWHLLRTLGLVFEDLSSKRFDDRYGDKRKTYRSRDRECRDRLFRIGVGVVDQPVAKASMPRARTLSGFGGAGLYYVKIAWRNASGESGEPSHALTHMIRDGGRLAVTAVAPPASAIAFDVYAGFTESGLSRQNSQPLSPASEWIAPETGLTTGPPPAPGQSPNRYVQANKQLRRG